VKEVDEDFFDES
jgi:hypothetical protein